MNVFNHLIIFIFKLKFKTDVYKKDGCKDGALNLDDLMMEKSYEPWKSYERSKICNILFTRSLAKRLDPKQVTVNALHPGIIMTEIDRNFAEAYRIPNFLWKMVNMVIFPLKLWIAKSINQGAQTQIYCSVAEELEGVSGLYFVDCRQKAYLPYVMDDSLADKVWKISEDLTKCKYD